MAQAHNNLGAALQDLGERDAAAKAFDQALALDPDYAEAHWNRALLWLCLGDYARGWEAYEWRWRRRDFPELACEQPRWRGEALTKKRLLIRAEQGFGDAIQMLRYLPEVQRRVAEVILELPRALTGLLLPEPGLRIVEQPSRKPEEADRARAETAPADLCIPLLSLPRILETRPESIVGASGYLRADPVATGRWRQRLNPAEKDAPSRPTRHVGLVWAGNPGHTGDWNRSIPPMRWKEILAIPEVAFHSLQKHPRPGDLETLAGLGPVDDWGSGLRDFADAAAAIEALDLIISVDTAVAHLAGAMGKAVWTLIPANPDWRWLLSRPHDTPWYDAMRLFRQPSLGDWAPTLEAVRQALADWVKHTHPAERSTPPSRTAPSSVPTKP